MSKRGLAQLHVAVFLLGWPALFARWVSLPAGMITFGRTLFAGLALAVLVSLSPQGFRVASRKDFLFLTLAGVLLALHWTAFFHAIQVSAVAVALLMCV